GVDCDSPTTATQPVVGCLHPCVHPRQRVAYRFSLCQILGDGGAHLFARVICLNTQPESASDLVEVALAIGHEQLIHGLVRAIGMGNVEFAATRIQTGHQFCGHVGDALLFDGCL